MTKKEFDLLVQKYHVGLCTQEEEKLIEKWAELHFKRQSEQSVFESEKEHAITEDRIWNAVQQSTGLLQPQRKFFDNRSRWMTRVGVMAVMFLIGVFLWMKIENHSILPSSISGIETKNSTGTQQRIVLPDSSIVMLEPGAAIIVSDEYGQKRRSVFLKGKAFFNVKHDREIPFLVFTGELVTEVLGTSFWITPQEKNKMIEVSVVTGKVSIYTESTGDGKKQNGVIAKSNQKVIYNSELKTMVQDLVTAPEIINSPPESSSFIFEEATLQTVLQLIQTCYGVDIIVGAPQLNDCMFTGDLGGLGLYEQLDHLCEVLHAQYTIRGTTIFINGDGCSVITPH